MTRQRGEAKYYYRFLCATIFTMISTGLFLFVWIRFVSVHNQTNELMGYGNLGMAIVIYAGLYVFVAYKLHGFRIGFERKASIIASQGMAFLLTDLSEVLISMAITGQFRFFFAFLWRYSALFLIQSLVIGLLVIPLVNFYRRVFPPLQVLEIYGDNQNDFCRKFGRVKYKYHVVDSVHYSSININDLIQKVDAVLINDIPAEKRNEILKYCFEKEKRVYFIPKIADIILKSAAELNLFDTPLYLCRNNGISRIQAVIKRVFDVICSFVALIVLSPLFLLTAIAIKIDDKGPVFFRQERCTINGKRFIIIKFRSMITNAEADGLAHPARDCDKRVTRVGKVIRATRIDELPQLINILKGDMSVVGPRPERVEHVKMYSEAIPEFAFRNKMKGGLTGYAQVYGKYNTSSLDKIKLDLVYITNYSLMMDIQIILETIKVLFRKDSTEGFSQEKSEEIRIASKTKKSNE